MKIKILLGGLICAMFAFFACQEEGEMQPAPPSDEIDLKVLSYNVNMPVDTLYTPTPTVIDSVQMCNFFGITYAEFKTQLAVTKNPKLKYYAINPADTTIDKTSPTANGNGHWFNANGLVCTWGSGEGRIYSEYVDDAFTFNIGQYPKKTSVGDTYKIMQGFYYNPDKATKMLVVHCFNISITAPARK